MKKINKSRNVHVSLPEDEDSWAKRIGSKIVKKGFLSFFVFCSARALSFCLSLIQPKRKGCCSLALIPFPSPVLCFCLEENKMPVAQVRGHHCQKIDREVKVEKGLKVVKVVLALASDGSIHQTEQTILGKQETARSVAKYNSRERRKYPSDE